jgi:hypothetical protein
MDGEQGGGGDPFEIPGLTGKTIARAGYTEFEPEVDVPPGERTKKVRNVRIDLVGGDVAHFTSLENVLVSVQEINVYPWLAPVPGLLPDPPAASAVFTDAQVRQAIHAYLHDSGEHWFGGDADDADYDCEEIVALLREQALGPAVAQRKGG